MNELKANTMESTEIVQKTADTSAGNALLCFRGFAGVGLYSPQNELNVGSALRAVQIYNASFLAITGKYKKAPTDTMCAYRHKPLFQVDSLKSIIPYDCIPVAVDLIEGAKPLPDYGHPERAFYIFGPENGTLDKSVTDWCRDTVCVPMNGCMNLAASVNVVLYDRMMKQWLKRI